MQRVGGLYLGPKVAGGVVAGGRGRGVGGWWSCLAGGALLSCICLDLVS